MTIPMMTSPSDLRRREGDQAPYDDDGYSWGKKHWTTSLDLLPVVSYLLTFPSHVSLTADFRYNIDLCAPPDGWIDE